MPHLLPSTQQKHHEQETLPLVIPFQKEFYHLALMSNRIKNNEKLIHAPGHVNGDFWNDSKQKHTKLKKCRFLDLDSFHFSFSTQ